MDRQTLERLAANPHYKMTQKQLDQLNAYRMQNVKHTHTPPKHPTNFETHSPELRKEEDERSDTNTSRG